ILCTRQVIASIAPPPAAVSVGGKDAYAEAAMTEQAARAQGLRVGLFGIGLDTYWPQFAGLEDRLTGYLEKVAGKLKRPCVEVVNLGLIDSPEKAAVAGHRFRQDRKSTRLNSSHQIISYAVF